MIRPYPTGNKPRYNVIVIDEYTPFVGEKSYSIRVYVPGLPQYDDPRVALGLDDDSKPILVYTKYENTEKLREFVWLVAQRRTYGFALNSKRIGEVLVKELGIKEFPAEIPVEVREEKVSGVEVTVIKPLPPGAESSKAEGAPKKRRGRKRNKKAQSEGGQ